MNNKYQPKENPDYNPNLKHLSLSQIIEEIQKIINEYGDAETTVIDVYYSHKYTSLYLNQSSENQRNKYL